MAYPNRSSSRPTMLCNGRWHLDAILDPDGHDPLHARLAFEGERFRIIVRRLTHLLEEELVQTPRCLGHQHPGSSPHSCTWGRTGTGVGSQACSDSQQAISRGALGKGRRADHAGIEAQGCLLNFDQVSAWGASANVYLLTGAL